MANHGNYMLQSPIFPFYNPYLCKPFFTFVPLFQWSHWLNANHEKYSYGQLKLVHTTFEILFEIFWTLVFFLKIFSSVSYITRLLMLTLNELSCSTPLTTLLLLPYLGMCPITTQRESRLGALAFGVQNSMVIIGWKVGES